MASWRTASALVVLSYMLLAPAAAAEPLDLSGGELYGLRIDAEYKLGPKDTSGHEEGAWGAGAPAPYANTGRDWVFAALGPLPGPVKLDSAGLVKVSAWLGGGDGELGQHDIAWELKAGDTVIAVGEAKELTFVMEIVALTWEVAPSVTTIEPSMGDLTFRVYSTGVGHGLRINLGETPGWTRLTLPVLSSDGGSTASTTTSASDTGTASATTTTSSGSVTSSSTTTFRDEESSTTSSSTSSTSTGNGTSDEKDSPAPPIALASLAVLVAAIAVRRRLR
jgi:MYXO-CTERM domain-containing protein